LPQKSQNLGFYPTVRNTDIRFCQTIFLFSIRNIKLAHSRHLGFFAEYLKYVIYLLSYILSYISGDLFDAPIEFSLAHCTSEDMHQGAGIVKQFNVKYGGIDFLKAQNKKVGDIAVLPIDVNVNRYVINLITKKNYYDKPKLLDIERSLYALKQFCYNHGVYKIAMPLIACGLDKQCWEVVIKKVEKVFGHSIFEIIIYTKPEQYYINDSEWPPLRSPKSAEINSPLRQQPTRHSQRDQGSKPKTHKSQPILNRQLITTNNKDAVTKPDTPELSFGTEVPVTTEDAPEQIPSSAASPEVVLFPNGASLDQMSQGELIPLLISSDAGLMLSTSRDPDLMPGMLDEPAAAVSLTTPELSVGTEVPVTTGDAPVQIPSSAASPEVVLLPNGASLDQLSQGESTPLLISSAAGLIYSPSRISELLSQRNGRPAAGAEPSISEPMEETVTLNTIEGILGSPEKRLAPVSEPDTPPGTCVTPPPPGLRRSSKLKPMTQRNPIPENNLSPISQRFQHINKVSVSDNEIIPSGSAVRQIFQVKKAV
jgi:hypothetical protein